MAFRIKQNDTSPSIQATLTDANLVPVDITNASVMFHMKATGGSIVVDREMTITDGEGGVVQYDWQSGDTITAGTYLVEFEVTYTDGSIETFPNTGSLIVVVTPELN